MTPPSRRSSRQRWRCSSSPTSGSRSSAPWCSSTSSASRRSPSSRACSSGGSCTYLFLHDAREFHAHPVQHAGALDVRRGSRTALGHARVREVLRHHRRRRGHRDRAGVAAAVRRHDGHLRGDRRSAPRARSTACCWRGRCCSPTGRSCSCSSSRCRRASPRCSWARWRSSAAAGGVNGSVAEATHLGGLRHRLAVPEGSHGCGRTSASATG